MKEHIFLASPHMSEEGYEKQYIEEAFEKNFIAPLGENVTGFEVELGEKIGARQGAALSSGTSAIHMALMALGIGAGDVVFTQSLTFSASANPVTYVGAEPVFIDSDYETWNMSPVALRAGLEKYKAMGRLPKAVIVVHLYGLAANMDEIVAICHEYGVPLVEDAAEGLGTTYTGACTGGKPKYIGTFGAYGIFSFNGNKIITTSGGGMLFCNLEDEELAKERIAKVRFWSTQSRDAARWYQHTEIGYNFRMSNIVAGIGRGQLKVLDQRIAKKQYIYEYYKKELGGLPGISLMPVADVHTSNCWLTAIQLAPECPVKPMDIILALEADDVESRPVWKPMHLQPVFADCDFIGVDAAGHAVGREAFHVTDEQMGADDSVSGTLFSHGVCLPSDTKMSDADLERIVGVIRALWK